jgi:shikimate kinase
VPPNLILIGPMGAGKSTVGAEVAKNLNLTFSDTDSLIEIDQGKSISDIFVEDGETHFRLVEESIVIDALKQEAGVLSLGGGAVMNLEVQRALKESGAKVIFLDISLSAVVPRIGFDTPRPLLMVNPRQRWNELMQERRPTYEALADLRVDVSELSVDQAVARIIASI